MNHFDLAQIKSKPYPRLRRGMYLLPSIFTAGNIAAGFFSITQTIDAISGDAQRHLDWAAIAILFAIPFDALDGRIARMTNTTSDFGREMDSLADVISFGIAPAVLAFAWGVQFVDTTLAQSIRGQLFDTGYFVAFLFLLCGAARLARFNVQKNPIPKNPGRPDRKYFVGLPIPAGALMVAAVVYASGAVPISWWPLSVAWLALLALLGFLMVSTWRYYSFKGIGLHKPHTPLIIVALGAFIYAMWNYAQPVMLALATAYVASGIAIRIGGSVRRRLRRAASPRAPEIPLG